jgi:hypothetical protein
MHVATAGMRKEELKAFGHRMLTISEAYGQTLPNPVQEFVARH